MTKKTSQNNLLIFLTFLLLVVNYKFFYLFPIGSFGARTNELLFSTLSILSFIIIFNKIRGYNYLFSNFIIILFLFFLIEVFYTIFKYPEPPMDAVKEFIPYLSLLSYLTFSSLAQVDLKRFLKIIIVLGTIIAFICILELFLHTHNFELFKIYGFNYGLTSDQLNDQTYLIRNGRSRLIGSDLIDFTGVISIGCLFNKEKYLSKKLLSLNIILVLFYEYYISQTRSTFMCLIFIAIVLVIIKYGKRLNTGITIGTLIITVPIVMTFAIRKIFTIQNNGTEYSTYHRIDEINYYLSIFKEKPIFGNGFLKDKPLYMEDYILIHGDNIYAGNAYSDVGLVGSIAKYGIFGLLLLIMLVIKEFIIIKRNKSLLLIALFIMTLLSMIDLSFLDAERLPSLCIYMAIFDGIAKSKKGV